MNTQDFNFQLIEEFVRTHYGDYSGYIQIDGHSGADLFNLCKDNGVDMEKYFLIGLSAGEHTISGIGNHDKLFVMALVIERSKYGKTFDEIQKYLQSNNGKAKAKKIHFEVKYSDLGKYIKRFDLMVVTKITQYISQLELE